MEEKGKSLSAILLFPLLPQEWNPARQGGQGRKADEDLAHVKANPWPTFQLWVQIKV